MITNEVKPYGRYRVTLLHDIEGTDDELMEAWNQDGVPERFIERLPNGVTRLTVPKKIAPAGTVYEGFASDIVEGFFDLNLDTGEAIGFYKEDTDILIEEL